MFENRDFPGGPVVKTSPSNAGGEGLIPGRGAKIPHALQPKNQNIKKQKQYRNKLKTLKKIFLKKIVANMKFPFINMRHSFLKLISWRVHFDQNKCVSYMCEKLRNCKYYQFWLNVWFACENIFLLSALCIPKWTIVLKYTEVIRTPFKESKMPSWVKSCLKSWLFFRIVFSWIFSFRDKYDLDKLNQATYQGEK